MNMNDIDPLHRELILSYLTPYEPGDVNASHCITKSSAEIQDDLSDMATIELEEIATVMQNQVYLISICIDGRPRWVLKRR